MNGKDIKANSSGKANNVKNKKFLDILKLMRIHHYLKNLLIFLPIVFSGLFLQFDLVLKVFFGTIAFSLIASSVYIINDIQDVEADRLHEIKCKRPIASGRIEITEAYFLTGILIVIALLINILVVDSPIRAIIILLIYLVLNILYSMGLKHKPIIDIAILVSGFLLRVLYGAIIINVSVSNWLYLTVISMSFFLGLGKRRNELNKKGAESRKVLKHYTSDFLDKNMYMSLAMTIVFYALWCVDPTTTARLSSELLIWTVPLVILICMKYSLIIEGDSYGDPVDVVLNDKVLILMILFYCLMTFFIIYINPIITLLR